MNFSKTNKKAQVQWETVIWIAAILLLVVLVLILLNVGGLRDKILAYQGGPSNLDSVRTQCKFACEQGLNTAYAGYLNDPIPEIIFGDKIKISSLVTCKKIESPICVTKDGKVLERDSATCTKLAPAYTWTRIDGREWKTAEGSNPAKCIEKSASGSISVDVPTITTSDLCLYRCEKSGGFEIISLKTKADCEKPIAGVWENAVITAPCPGASA